MTAGRPKYDKKDKRLARGIRFSDEEFESIKKAMTYSKMKCTISEFVREVSLKFADSLLKNEIDVKTFMKKKA
jgi:hypothetical protein